MWIIQLAVPKSKHIKCGGGGGGISVMSREGGERKRGGGFHYFIESTKDSKYPWVKEKRFWQISGYAKGFLEKWTRTLWIQKIKYMARRIDKGYEGERA